MITIESLLLAASDSTSTQALEMDALRDEDALLEAQLLDLRVSTLRSVAGFLFEFRTSLHFDEGNAAVTVPEIGEVPPAYVESSFDEVARSLPSWSSACTVLQTSRRSVE
jgi:hypothetical protein